MPDLLKAKEVADILRITTAKVYELTRDGKLPYYPVGGTNRYSREDILKYLESIKK